MEQRHNQRVSSIAHQRVSSITHQRVSSITHQRFCTSASFLALHHPSNSPTLLHLSVILDAASTLKDWLPRQSFFASHSLGCRATPQLQNEKGFKNHSMEQWNKPRARKIFKFCCFASLAREYLLGYNDSIIVALVRKHGVRR